MREQQPAKLDKSKQEGRPMPKTPSADEYEAPLVENDTGILARETGFSIEKATLRGESVSNYIEDTLPKLMVIDGKPVISSLEVAQMFGKEHKDVLKGECPNFCV